jgi:hypothetical protein
MINNNKKGFISSACAVQLIKHSDGEKLQFIPLRFGLAHDYYKCICTVARKILWIKDQTHNLICTLDTQIVPTKRCKQN